MNTTPDQTTTTAFRELWNLLKHRRDYDTDDPAAVNRLIEQGREICERAAAAEDPELIQDFAAAVICSIERMNQKNKTTKQG